eukprot:CAMPEP_0117084348 /NCGR_PEP_ID=MMETSP0472-20121206/59357_1 /TAXON_ID=693140 ORGANISM="Tiarina fusus, Strain LIS" /NCGR_SAMPLE_ID=MMETSP0472 /ASSEMBLY_ACC=CAM_ASM_000603 /LENGTH=46 /DNA_ID= /DNA_START= /DNA_END= /DNA_ORIENTATION=
MTQMHLVPVHFMVLPLGHFGSTGGLGLGVGLRVGLGVGLVVGLVVG